MQEVSEAMVREVLAEDALEPATLITFVAAELPEPIRATDHPDGLISRGEEYRFFPFRFSFGGASAEEVERAARLEIANTDGMIVEALRTLSQRPTITAELVRVLDPDNVELAIVGAEIDDIDASSASVTMTIRPRAFDRRFACSKRYVIARTPSLF